MVNCCTNFILQCLLFNLSECPEGFVSGIYGLQCYLFVNETMTFDEADEFCQNKDAYLAELIEEEERKAVREYFKGFLYLENIF